MSDSIVLEGQSSLTFHIANSRPVELIDLTSALAAFGDAYQDFVVNSGFDTDRRNIRLYVKEIRAGSIIAELFSIAQQISIIDKHDEIAAAFLSNLNEIIQFFLGLNKPTSIRQSSEPTKKEAQQIVNILEPIAKDGSSQLFLNVQGDMHIHLPSYSYGSLEANAVQNGVRRYLGPPLPSSHIRHDQLLKLFQVRDGTKGTVGDKGIIEEISTSPVKLIFASEEVKRIVLEQSYPFQHLFLVDAEVKTSEGKAALYRIISVKDIIPLP